MPVTIERGELLTDSWTAQVDALEAALNSADSRAESATVPALRTLPGKGSKLPESADDTDPDQADATVAVDMRDTLMKIQQAAGEKTTINR